MVLNFLLLLVGFVALIFGATKLVEAASSIAVKLGIPSIVIGLTIVAFGTSAPELVVNMMAAFNGSTEVVMGNVLGSNIFNILGILGISAVIYPLTVKTSTTWLEIPLSLLAAVCVLIVAADVALDGASVNLVSRSEGLILLLFFIIFLVYNLVIAKSGETTEEMATKDYATGKAVIFIILGFAGLILGGRLIVDNAVEIAELAGLSERVIGLTVISVGTSLPELATSIVAVRKKNLDIAIGNVVGSNIFNIFFILGLSTTITPVAINAGSFVDIFTNIAASLLLFLFIFTGKGRKVERWEGILFLILYIIYVTYLITT
jgi:cation:H+ antiporter